MPINQRKKGDSSMKDTSFIQLIKDNPELPILPMVSYEIAAEDCPTYWGGSWGKSSIEEYLVVGERITYKGNDDPVDLLEEMLSTDEFEQMTDDEILLAYEALPWIKAIIVYIELPDV